MANPPNEPPLTILEGDCRITLRTLPEKSVHCVVTSPPYYGLRDYGHSDQIGLEETPTHFIAELVQVFREVHRVLRDDGTLWMNMGDSYAGSGRGTGDTKSDNRGNEASRGSRIGSVHGESGHTSGQPVPRGSCLPAGMHETARQAGAIGRAWVKPPGGFKAKDLMGMPWRLAFALQADGWYLRQDIIWHKPNPMPESISDRCTKAHEYIFLLSKSSRYHYDADAIKEKVTGTAHDRGDGVNPKSRAVPAGWDTTKGEGGHGTIHRTGRTKAHGKNSRMNVDRDPNHPTARKNKQNESFSEYVTKLVDTRNKRSVWTVATAPYSAAHFATFPPDLIKPCILAGCRPGGVVLDPFGGSGTTGKVALELGRKAILCEINPDYVALIKERTTTTLGFGF